ncbi:hypothetical protein [Massilia sp. DD77]|uniref:hypothetical protein n=1 Tax=Massilia sp. DD77 TaxID=3109349 RepID=UPI002FFE1EBE
MNQNDQNTNTTASTIADLEARDTAWLEVQNKKDDGPLLFNGRPVRIEVRSPGTREALSAQHRQEQANTAKTFAAMRGKPVKETVDDKIAQSADKLTAVTANIDGLPVTATELYSNPKLGYITEQVAKFHGDWANF